VFWRRGQRRIGGAKLYTAKTCLDSSNDRITTVVEIEVEGRKRKREGRGGKEVERSHFSPSFFRPVVMPAMFRGWGAGEEMGQSQSITLLLWRQLDPLPLTSILGRGRHAPLSTDNTFPRHVEVLRPADYASARIYDNVGGRAGDQCGKNVWHAFVDNVILGLAGPEEAEPNLARGMLFPNHIAQAQAFL
jgi:hypothetical protein